MFILFTVAIYYTAFLMAQVIHGKAVLIGLFIFITGLFVLILVCLSCCKAVANKNVKDDGNENVDLNDNKRFKIRRSFDQTDRLGKESDSKGVSTTSRPAHTTSSAFAHNCSSL